MSQSKPKMFRVHTPCAVRHPESGGYVTPDPRQAYPADDPLVKAYPWMFVEEGRTEQPAPAPDSVPIEAATRAPGETRATRRRR